MTSLNDNVETILERLWHPTTVPGIVIRAPRPIEKNPVIAKVKPYSPDNVTRNPIPSKLPGRNSFIIKDDVNFVEGLLDRFSPRKKFKPDHMAELTVKGKLGNMKDKIVSGVKKVDSINTKIDNWMDDPAY